MPGAIRDVPDRNGAESGSDQGDTGFRPPRPPASWRHGQHDPQSHAIGTHRFGPGSPPARNPRPAPPSAAAGEEHLHRCRHGRMLAGVAAGLADYFDIDPTLVRIGFVALALLGGLALPLYVAGWLLIPEEDADQSVAEELLARERAR